MGYDLERIVLRAFFDDLCSLGPLDSSISDSEVVRTTQNKLKAALKDVEHKCTCAKLKYYWPCELCQGSDKEVVFLRHFFQQLRNAKTVGMAPKEIHAFIENTKTDMRVGG